MENLVHDLKENLALNRENEYDKVQKLSKEKGRKLLLISFLKIFKLDFLIKAINEILSYSEQTKKIVK